MNSDFVAILAVQNAIRAQLHYEEDPGEEAPSRIRRAAAALGQRFTSIVTYAREKAERPDVARDPVSTGD
jgi:uncharacterized protein YciW